MRPAHSLLLGLLLPVFSLVGCPEETTDTDDDGPVCGVAFLGDNTADPVFEVFYLASDGSDQPIIDDGPIDLIEPPQGGRVMFVGVRATNIDPCGATITGALRDTTTNQVRLDVRTVNLVDEGDGYGRSAKAEISSYANIPACHNSWSDLDIFDASFGLEVVVEDSRKRKTTRTLTVRPRCAETSKQAQCLCICDGDYVLGASCEGSGGGGLGGGGVGGGT